MKYLAAKFNVNLPTDDAILRQTCLDLISSYAGEAGFESFEEHDGVLTGYVQDDVFDRRLLDSLLADFPVGGATLSYTIDEAEYKDWNEPWEQEGFEPIEIEGRCVIHDTKHPVTVKEGMLDITIDARLAFGSGTHATTQMVVGELLTLDLRGKQVLDCGCGTGILSVVASKCGASSVVAYDIDEWSVENTQHNARLNGVDHIDVLAGDVHILSHVSGLFDVVVANINRNVLLADMSEIRSVMSAGAVLIISGFYDTDAPMLVAEANRLGLTLTNRRQSADWVLLSFSS